MRYLIYTGIAALVVWSVITLWRNIRRQMKGGCDGCCGTCYEECPSSRDNPSCKSSDSPNGGQINPDNKKNENTLSQE